MSNKPSRTASETMIGAGVLVVIGSALGGYFAFVRSFQRIADSPGVAPRPEDLANEIVSAMPYVYAAILCGVVGAGMLVAGVVIMFVDASSEK